jgi:hypothetical protein
MKGRAEKELKDQKAMSELLPYPSKLPLPNI